MKIYVFSKKSNQNFVTFYNEDLVEIAVGNRDSIIAYDNAFGYLDFILWLSKVFTQLEFCFVTIDSTFSEKWEKFSVDTIVEQNKKDILQLVKYINLPEATISI